MKKVLFLAICLMMVAGSLIAQEEYRKPTLLVAGFKYSGNVSQSESETLRNSVISYLSRKPRIRLIDLNTATKSKTSFSK